MGNDQSIPKDKQNLPKHNILIVIRGQRSTGKTELISRFRGNSFNSTYVPTFQLTASEIVWISPEPRSELITVKIWDCVEKALPPGDSNIDIPLADASTVDSYSQSDGLVIVIDSRYGDTVDLAESILKQAPF